MLATWAPEATADDWLLVLVEGEIDAPAGVVEGVLLDLERFPEWFPALSEWRVLEHEPGNARVYGRQSLPWPVDDRDYVVRYRWWHEAGGRFVLEATGIDDGTSPLPPDTVRVTHLRTRWRVEARGSGSHVEYAYEGDPGPLPTWVMRLAWRSQTRRVIDGLRDAAALRTGGTPALR